MTADIKNTILAKVKSMYDRPGTPRLLRITSLLDPRYRMDHIEAEHLTDTKNRVVVVITMGEIDASQPIQHTEAAQPRQPEDDAAETSAARPQTAPPKKRRVQQHVSC